MGSTGVANVRRDIVHLSHVAGFIEVDEGEMRNLLESDDQPRTNEDFLQLEQEMAVTEEEEEPQPQKKTEPQHSRMCSAAQITTWNVSRKIIKTLPGVERQCTPWRTPSRCTRNLRFQKNAGETNPYILSDKPPLVLLPLSS